MAFQELKLKKKKIKIKSITEIPKISAEDKASTENV